MKRIFCLILSALLIFSLCACHQEEKIQKPVNFYYRTAEVTYGSSDGLIAVEVAESEGYTEVISLLNDYLKGPEDDSYQQTFPDGTWLLDAYIAGGTVYLEMNGSFAMLTGVDLSIGCACLAMTALELVDATAVCIYSVNATLDGAATITLTMDDLLLEDYYTPETT